jgi:hypothetical protein
MPTEELDRCAEECSHPEVWILARRDHSALSDRQD